MADVLWAAMAALLALCGWSFLIERPAGTTVPGCDCPWCELAHLSVDEVVNR